MPTPASSPAPTPAPIAHGLAHNPPQGVYHSDDPDTLVVERGSIRWGALSPGWHDGPVTLGGLYLRSSEHLFQAMKFEGDPAQQEQIARAVNAPEAVRASLKRRPDAGFHIQRIEARLWALAVWTEVNSLSLGTVLDATGDRQIAIERKGDAFWGVRKHHPGRFAGRNALGMLWQIVREARHAGTLRSLIGAQRWIIGHTVIGLDPTESSRCPRAHRTPPPAPASGTSATRTR